MADDDWRVIVRYRANKPGLARCALGKELKRSVHEVAVLAQGYAELISPDGFNDYQGKFEVLDEVLPDFPYRQNGEPPMPRVCGTLINQSDLAVLVEVGGGSGKNYVPDYRVLTRTLDWLVSVADVE